MKYRALVGNSWRFLPVLVITASALIFGLPRGATAFCGSCGDSGGCSGGMCFSDCGACPVDSGCGGSCGSGNPCDSCAPYANSRYYYRPGRFVFRVLRGIGRVLTCGSGCGGLYVDEWYSDPPDCYDPCFDGGRQCGGFGHRGFPMFGPRFWRCRQRCGGNWDGGYDSCGDCGSCSDCGSCGGGEVIYSGGYIPSGGVSTGGCASGQCGQSATNSIRMGRMRPDVAQGLASVPRPGELLRSPPSHMSRTPRTSSTSPQFVQHGAGARPMIRSGTMSPQGMVARQGTTAKASPGTNKRRIR